VLKLAPVVRALDAAGDRFDVKVCLSGQHGALARDIAHEIGLRSDVAIQHDGGVAQPGASPLSASLSSLLERLSAAIGSVAPRGVLVQGDTTTALAGALAAFHHGVPCFHVEAGLRTSDRLRPFPEETNRRLVTRLAALHFAPTESARRNLLAEGVADADIVVTGNTVIDALAQFGGEADLSAVESRPMVLVTLHRREGAETAPAIARAVAELAHDVDVTWIGHPNPTSEAALAALGAPAGVRVLPPQSYAAFVSLMRRARVILTDSGGVQEEAPALGVPVVVLRNETDRPEAVTSGNAVVVGADASAIVRTCRELVNDAEMHARRSRAVSPFGDGSASPRIVAAIERYFATRR
jgi:UDP-N-acetylglucosamine 2-epimerase (non-hydrolysing)